MNAIPQELYAILHAICKGTRCDNCLLAINGPGIHDCMSALIKTGHGESEYFERVWEAYKRKCPGKIKEVSNEVKEFLGVMPPAQINITEDDMMNLFS